MFPRALILVMGVALWSAEPAPEAALFDFDTAPVQSPLPIGLTVDGITADFSATGQGFSIQAANTMGFTPAGFSGNCIYPSSINAADLLVSFSTPLTEFSILYAPQELACDSSATMRVTAYLNSVWVGTATTNASAGTWPTETLAFSSTQGFDKVVIHYDKPPVTGGDWGPIFMADNMSVTAAPVPEPMSMGLTALVLGLFAGLRRRHRRQLPESKPAGSYLRESQALAAPITLVALGLFASSGGRAQASIAYGSINNFDTVNDTGVPTHGFEIELDDIGSTDITYTYDWNHYGVPSITEDSTSVPGHTNVFVRYAAVNVNGVWSAYTAVPAGPIAPTQGHQFTNPSTNFGGEHFGVGYRILPTTNRFNWLIDNGAGVLVHGPPVNVPMPTFNYIAPAGAAPAQVQAAIAPPPPPVPPPTEFGAAGWVKEIRTTSHNNAAVKLRNLISPDPDYPDLQDWRNGEPDEVEVEWQILQVDYNAANGGANGQLVAAAQNLNQGDDVVTRRYEFYEYVGPLDAETGEALAQSVGPDGIHGGTNSTYANEIVVGKYLGAQMSAYDPAPPLGLIDHLPDGVINGVYASRSLVIAADTNFTAMSSGALPEGMAFDPVTGQVYGTPGTTGVFTFHVEVSAANGPILAKTYIFTIAPAGVVLPAHSSVDTSASPLNGGTTTGDGVYTNGTSATVAATPAAGFTFVNWSDNGSLVSTSASYQFTSDVNRSLVANFVSAPQFSLSTPQAQSMVIAWPTNFSGYVLQENTDLHTTNWVAATNALNVVGTSYQANIPTTNGRRFFRLMRP